MHLVVILELVGARPRGFGEPAIGQKLAAQEPLLEPLSVLSHASHTSLGCAA